MMCLAEALLRIPDAHTADELIADKLAGPDWSEKLGAFGFGVRQRRDLLAAADRQGAGGRQDRSDNWRAALGRAVGRLGEPVVRTAVREAMKILGRNFVFGRTIDEALKRAEPERRKGLSHSFDMLGEAAKTYADAERYAQAYRGALDRIAKEAKGGFRKSPGISVKLSALHPRFEYTHARRSAGGGHCRSCASWRSRRRRLTSTSPSTPKRPTGSNCRWTCSRRCLPTTSCSRTAGAASASRSRPIRSAPCRLCDWVIEAARTHGRKLMFRLVKGAYWDTEIKAAQVGGLTDYPVFTRKVATDVSYLACAKKLLGGDRRRLSGLRHPQRQHHRRR